MPEFNLTAKQIDSNWKIFRQLINDKFPTRRDALNRMYDDFEDDMRVQMAPASTYEHFHNAIPGGYIDHVLRVYKFTLEHYDMWKRMGLMVDNFTSEELSFAALHHDLGKLGLSGANNEKYLHNDSKWHRDNQGKIYKVNPNLPWMPTSDVTFYLLNEYGVQYSIAEMLGIKLTDGLYDEVSKPYFINYDVNNKLRNNIPYILHHADLMASRYEFERWAKATGKFKFDGKYSAPKQQQLIQKPNSAPAVDAFNEMFGQ